MQCRRESTYFAEIWNGEDIDLNINATTFRAADPLPMCKNCSSMARPNVLMMDDDSWIGRRLSEQTQNYRKWQASKLTANSKLVVIEVGAGVAIPTVRRESEARAFKDSWKGELIRINLHDTGAPTGSIVLPMSGKEALTRIEVELNKNNS